MKRRQALVALAALLGVVLCYVVIFQAGDRMYEVIGPSRAVAAPDGDLYVVSRGALHVFRPDGARRKVVELAGLGLTRIPSDVAVHRDGRIVVANAEDTRLTRCTLASATCEQVQPEPRLTPVFMTTRLNTAKVFIDEERSRYFISDNAGHRLLLVGFDGHEIASTAKWGVWRPNQLALERPDRLRVADTNHRRIAFFKVEGDRIGQAEEVISTDSKFARPGREWPMSSVRLPSGELWVLVAAEGMKDADLIVFDVSGKAVRRIDLGDDADPFDLEIWGNRVIVSDGTRYRVDALDFSGRPVAALNDPQFAGELEEGRHSVAMWRGARTAARIGVVAIPIVAIVILHFLGVSLSWTTRPAQVPASISTAPMSQEIRWLSLDRAYYEHVRRNMLILMLIVTSIFALVLSITLRFVGWDGILSNTMRRRQFLAMAAVVVAYGFLAAFATRIAKRSLGSYRLGASAEGLHFESAPLSGIFNRARNGVAPWQDVFYDGTRLLAGRRMLATKSQMGAPMFGVEELRSAILVHVPSENFVTTTKLLTRSLSRWHIGLLGILVAFLVLDLAHIVWLLSKTRL